MHTIVLLIHIFSMMTSVIAMSSALLFGLCGKSIAARIASIAMAAIVFGGFSGVLLLINSPLQLSCLFLTAYVLGSAALYVWGFGAGVVQAARFIRRSAVVHTR